MASNNISGDYNHISIDQIVASAKMRLRIGDSGEDDIFLERYANEGARHFDSLSTFVKRQCDLELVNGKAKLPNGFYQMLAVGSCDAVTGFVNYWYVDQPFLETCGVDMQGNFIAAGGLFQIQDGYIYVTVGANYSNNHGTSVLGTSGSTTTNASSVASGPVFITNNIKIAFIGMNVDDNGMMVVYSDMERGLVAYCVWMYMLDSPAGKYTPQQISANEQIWINQKKWYKSIQFQNNFRNNKRAIASVTNAWISKKDWYL